MVSEKRPNLLYIHTDQHNPYVTGCYGDPLVQTPNLDRLAGSGAIFENAYCPSPICCPSRMSMLTGKHPYQNEVWTNNHILNSGVPTLAHAMGAAGYRPVLIGRLHSMGPDQLRGYTERLVGDHAANHSGGQDLGRGVLDGTNNPHRISLEKSGSGQSAYELHDEEVTTAAIDYLNQRGKENTASPSTDPFSLTVGLMLPHAPYVAHKKDYELYRDTITQPEKPRAFTEESHSFLRWWREHTNIKDVSDEEILRSRAAYWALVTRVDAMIGQIITTLEKNHLADDTLIVYTSDHGDMVGEHGLWWKHTFYEESVKVPLIMSWPGVIPAGQRCANVVSALDVNATILDALTAPPLPHSAGRSLLEQVTGKTTEPWENVAFSEYCADQFAPEGGCYQRMIRRDDWKLIYYHGQEPQLFNLADDPKETINLAEDPAYQEIRQDLTDQVLDGWDPEKIKARMADMRVDNQILTAWAQQTLPEDTIRWELKPEMNYLDED